MQTTVNYGLNKPDTTDFYNVADHNANMDAIDTALKEQADAIEANSDAIQTNANAIRNVEASVMSPTDIRDMISSTPVANATTAEWASNAGNATNAEYAANAGAVGGRGISGLMTRSSGRVDSLGFDNENRLHIHIDGSLYQIPFGYSAEAFLLASNYQTVIDSLKSDQDNRYVNTKPNDYNSVFKIMGLKDNNAIGLPGTGVNYSHVFGMRGWHDYTGGAAHEFALCQNGLIYHRFGETDAWSNWELVMGSNFTRPVIVSATAPADTSAVWIVPS